MNEMREEALRMIETCEEEMTKLESEIDSLQDEFDMWEREKAAWEIILEEYEEESEDE